MTEGQFDSMLLENAIATSGASKARSILLNLGAKEASTIVFDRDKAGKAQMMNFIKQGYSVFLWNKAIGELKRRYSSEDDIIELSSTQRVKDMNDLFSFIHKRNPEYTVQDFNDWVNKHLSDSVFDLAYL
jgi:guanylate kinase